MYVRVVKGFTLVQRFLPNSQYLLSKPRAKRRSDAPRGQTDHDVQRDEEKRGQRDATGAQGGRVAQAAPGMSWGNISSMGSSLGQFDWEPLTCWPDAGVERQ